MEWKGFLAFALFSYVENDWNFRPTADTASQHWDGVRGPLVLEFNVCKDVCSPLISKAQRNASYMLLKGKEIRRVRLGMGVSEYYEPIGYYRRPNETQTICCLIAAGLAHVRVLKKLYTLLDLCVSSLRRGHANLLCIIPIFNG